MPAIIKIQSGASSTSILSPSRQFSPMLRAPPPESLAAQHDVLNRRLSKLPVILSSRKPQIIALLIGIDDYLNVTPSNWHGAVDCTLQFKSFLENDLGLSGSCQIITLLNSAASRKAIMSELGALRKSAIENGQPVFIYYAGHGGEAFCPDGRTPTLQFIVPYDYSPGAGLDVSIISHQEIAAELDEPSALAGDNITLILDCSHSTPEFVAPITLHPNHHSRHGGSLQLSRFMFIEARNPYAPESSTAVHTENFSLTILRLLHEIPPCELRCSKIMSYTGKFTGQAPRGEDPDFDRTLFNGEVHVDYRYFFQVTTDSGSLVLDAGTAQGITPGAQFAVYAKYKSDESEPLDIFIQKPLGIFCVHSVETCRAILVPTPQHTTSDFEDIFAGPFYAMQTKAGNDYNFMRLYLPPQVHLPCRDALLSRIYNKDTEGDHLISIVNDANEAHIEIGIEDGKVVFLIRDQTVLRHGLSRLRYQVNPTIEEIFPILKLAAKYYSQINLMNNHCISDDVRFEVYKARSSLEKRNLDIAAGTNLWDLAEAIGPPLVQNGKVDLTIEGNEYLLGLKLVNDSSHDLYVYLYYFNASDLAIDLVYPLPNSKSHSGVPPIKKNGGVASIGYENDARTALSFHLCDDQKLDVGFFKLVWSTKPVTPLSDPLVESVIDSCATGALVPVIQCRSSKNPDQIHLYDSTPSEVSDNPTPPPSLDSFNSRRVITIPADSAIRLNERKVVPAASAIQLNSELAERKVVGYNARARFSRYLRRSWIFLTWFFMWSALCRLSVLSLI